MVTSLKTVTMINLAKFYHFKIYVNYEKVRIYNLKHYSPTNAIYNNLVKCFKITLKFRPPPNVIYS